MNITWIIDTLDRRTSDGFVTTAHWRAIAVDGDYIASVYGSRGWSEGQPTIPYANLTQQEVLNWVWASGVDKAATELSLAAQIADQKNSTSATGIPWGA